MAVVSPLHVGSIRGKPVRFFETPNEDGQPDLPWHSVEDLMASLELPRAHRRGFLQQMQKDKHVRMIATADGLIPVGPHPAAQGFLEAGKDCGFATADDEMDHRFASVADTLKIPALRFLQFRSNAYSAWMKAAMNPHGPVQWPYDNAPEDSAA
jgi:hypothetical protein